VNAARRDAVRTRQVRPIDSDAVPAAMRYLKQKAQRADVTLDALAVRKDPVVLQRLLHDTKILVAAALDACHEFEDARMPRLHELLGATSTSTETKTTANAVGA